MARFFDNMSGKQKLILIFGGFVFLIGAIALLPDEFQRLVDTAKEFFWLIPQFVRDFGGTP